MEKLIQELTGVVKENKLTLLQMSEINKQQENIINSQSMALLTKVVWRIINRIFSSFEWSYKLPRHVAPIAFFTTFRISWISAIVLTAVWKQTQYIVSVLKPEILYKIKIILHYLLTASQKVRVCKPCIIYF